MKYAKTPSCVRTAGVFFRRYAVLSAVLRERTRNSKTAVPNAAMHLTKAHRRRKQSLLPSGKRG